MPSARAWEWAQRSYSFELRPSDSPDFILPPSSFFLSDAGPSWLMNALPGSHFRAQYVYDRNGDREVNEPAYVGTLSNVFDVSLFGNVAPFVRNGSPKSSSPLVADNTASPSTYTWNGGTSGTPAWLSASNWTGGAASTYPGVLAATNASAGNANDVAVFGPGTGASAYNNVGINLNATNISLSVGAIAVTGASPVTIGQSSTTVNLGTRNLTLNGAYVGNGASLPTNTLLSATGSDLIINPTAGGAATSPLGLRLGITNGIINSATGKTIAINVVISESASGSGFTKTGAGVLLLTAANTYSGDTVINAGEVRFSSTSSSNSSTIRLGDTIVDSPSATLSLSNAFGGASGASVGSPLEVRASASGSQGTRLLRSLATTGTNTYSGIITMNADLTLQSSSNLGVSQGTLLLQGNSVAINNHVLKVDDALDGTPGNLNTQGIVTINELISGTGGSIVKNGGGTLYLQGTGNTYTGGTQIGGGLLGIYGDQSLGAVPGSPGTNVQFTGSATLQDTSNNISLNASRNITVASSSTTATFDSNGNTFSIAGVISGSGNLNKTGAGSLVLTGNNTYSGTTLVSGGTLNAAAVGALGGTTGSITVNNAGTLMVSGSGNLNRINDTTPIVLGNASGGNPTFTRSGSGVVSEGVGAHRTDVATVTGTSSIGLGALSLQSNATFAFGTGGVGTFTFASFTPNSFTLNVTGWTGSNANIANQSSGIDGTDDRLIFAGLAAPNTAFITFDGAASGAILLDAGFWEVVPLTAVPEPSTWIGAALSLGAIGYTQRRKLHRLIANRA